MPISAPFLQPKFPRLSATRLKLAPHRIKVIDGQSNGPGLAWLVVRLPDKSDLNIVPPEHSACRVALATEKPNTFS